MPQMANAGVATEIAFPCCSSSSFSYLCRITRPSVKRVVHGTQLKTTSHGIFLLVRASSRREHDSSSNIAPATLQEDVKYLSKLGAGSVIGAAAIKYGSAMIPEITRPNIVLALFLISAPMAAAIFLLLRQSHKD